MDEQFFNRHYVSINEQSHIVSGFSDAFQQPCETDILTNDKGGRHFRLSPDGEDSPPLFNNDGIPLYKWDASASCENEPWLGIVTRTENDVEIDLIPSLRQLKVNEIDRAREAVINAGVSVSTSRGEFNFSLTDRDQMNLDASFGALTRAQAGMPSPVDLNTGVFYHADGHPHEFWSCDDFEKICFTAYPFITEHIVYYKKLRRHIESLTTRAEIEAVHYGMEVSSS